MILTGGCLVGLVAPARIIAATVHGGDMTIEPIVVEIITFFVAYFAAKTAETRRHKELPMTMLLAGVMLWSIAHLFKRLAPATREGMGDGGKLVRDARLVWQYLRSWLPVIKAQLAPFGGFASQHGSS